jgi:plasmid stability protein
MSNLLIRGLPSKVHQKIKKLAVVENLSVNQEVICLLAAALEQAETEKEREARRRDAFRRIREIREENYRIYGLSEDSTKLIREDRDTR